MLLEDAGLPSLCLWQVYGQRKGYKKVFQEIQLGLSPYLGTFSCKCESSPLLVSPNLFLSTFSVHLDLCVISEMTYGFVKCTIEKKTNNCRLFTEETNFEEVFKKYPLWRNFAFC